MEGPAGTEKEASNVGGNRDGGKKLGLFKRITKHVKGEKRMGEMKA